jgi:hypothetical protein
MKIKLKRLFCFLLSSFICVSSNVLFAKADTQFVSKTASVSFSEGQQQSQSQTVNLPNLASVDSITVDNGNVNFTQNVTSLTINVSGGSIKRTYTPSEAAASTSDQYLNSSFPATKFYNDGTYSGTLNQSGSPYVISGSYAAQSSKYVSVTNTGYYAKDYIRCIDNSNHTVFDHTDGYPPTTSVWYDDGQYSGNIPGVTFYEYNKQYTAYYYHTVKMTNGQLYNSYNRNVDATYAGTVYYAGYDTRTWRQNYSGTVYAATQNYYSYTVTVNYKAQYTKPVLTVTPDNSNNQINLNWTMSDTTQAYTYVVYRKGPSEQSFQSMASSLTGTSWTDTSGKDAAPPQAPSIAGISHSADFSQYTINYSSADSGTVYQYYVEATGQTDETKIQSPTVSSTITTEIRGYSIVVNNNSGTVPNGTITTPASSFTFPKPASNGFYVHVSAIDNAGNVSGATQYQVNDFISVTHPVSISYTIDPNSSTPFTAPNIPITNNSSIPINVSVQSLSASSGGSIHFNDVSPTKYPDWSKLTAAQTKSDIALGIGVAETAASSGTWSSIHATNPIYSINITSKTLLGTLNPNGATGNLSVSAYCGIAWDNAYTSMHNLVLVFDAD